MLLRVNSGYLHIYATGRCAWSIWQVSLIGLSWCMAEHAIPDPHHVAVENQTVSYDVLNIWIPSPVQVTPEETPEETAAPSRHVNP
jgi:hypothetical protein